MTGLLLGIMLARSVSSFAAAAWGWRSIYAISAVLMLLTSLALVVVLPRRQPGSQGQATEHFSRRSSSWPALNRCSGAEPSRQACLFGAFTVFWTAIAYELIDKHHLSQAGVAVFALVGAAGAAAAPIAGRLGDAGHGSVSRLAALGLGVVALVLAGCGASNLYLLAAAGVLLDLAVQSHQVLSLRDIYALHPDARARVNAVYMTSVFLGGALASAITALLLQHWGWTGIALFAAALPTVGIALWLSERVRLGRLER